MLDRRLDLNKCKSCKHRGDKYPNKNYYECMQIQDSDFYTNKARLSKGATLYVTNNFCCSLWEVSELIRNDIAREIDELSNRRL